MKNKQSSVGPRIPLTKEAFDDFNQKYRKLKEEREEVMARLKTAREMGDLSENGAYKYAKFELGSIGRQLRELRHIIENAEVKEKSTTDTAGFGNIITLESNGKQLSYTLVSQHESDLSKMKLSIESPIGQAIVGKKVGDIAIVDAPAGKITYNIVSIE